MPKYRNKQRLKKIITSGKKINSLTRHLILEGHSYEEAVRGLEPFVSWWERSVRYIEQSSADDIGCSEEYDHDLWARSELHEVLKYASEEELSRYEHRIARADLAFRSATTESDNARDHIKNPDKEQHWWLFRFMKHRMK